MKKIVHIVRTMEWGGTQIMIEKMINCLPEYPHSIITTAILGEHPFTNQNIPLFEIRHDITLSIRSKLSSLKPDCVVFHWFPWGSDNIEKINPKNINSSLRWITIIHKADYKIPLNPNISMYVCVSEFISNFHNHIPQKQKCVIQNGVKVKKFSYPERSQNRAIPVIGKFCRGSHERFDYKMMKVLESINDIDWLMRICVTSGCMIHTVRSWILEFSLQKKIELIIDSKNIPDELKKVDIFLDFNADYFREAWGLAITEALASGLPVVGREQGAICEQIIDGENGYLCKTSAEVATKLRYLIKKPKERIRMGILAARYANDNFNEDLCIEAYRKLIKTILFG